MKVNSKLLGRIDAVIDRNKKHESIIIALSIVIFIVGVTGFVYGLFTGNAWVITPSTLITGLLYWPINKIDQIRKDNTALAVLPSLIATLEPKDAAIELPKLLAKLY